MGTIKNVRNYINQNEFKIILNNNIIDIQNYINIDKIDEKEMIILSSNKKIIIKGNNLSINRLMSNELLITGKYNNILFEDKNE